MHNEEPHGAIPNTFSYETIDEEAARLGAIFATNTSVDIQRYIALESMYQIKDTLDRVPKRKLYRRWRLTYTAKKIAKEHNLIVP